MSSAPLSPAAQVTWVAWTHAAIARQRLRADGVQVVDLGRTALEFAGSGGLQLLRTQLPVGLVASALAHVFLTDVRAQQSAHALDPADSFVWAEDVVAAALDVCARGQFGERLDVGPDAQVLATLLLDRAGLPADAAHGTAIAGFLLAVLLSDLQLGRSAAALVS